MSGKQTVAGGFDLDRFVGGAAQPEDPREMDAPVSAASKPRRSAVKKPAKEFMTERVQIRMTVEELAKLKEIAGLVPLSAFLRKHLKDSDLI